MSKQQERAVALYTQGSSCSQAIFSAYSETYGFDDALSHRLCSGLGGGLGGKGYVCGAISGAVLVLGLAYGNESNKNILSKEAMSERTARFINDCETLYGTSQCAALVEGLETHKEFCGKLISQVCEKLEKALSS